MRFEQSFYRKEMIPGNGYLIDNHLRGGIMANNPRRGGMERRAGKSGFAARPGAESRREGDCEP